MKNQSKGSKKRFGLKQMALLLMLLPALLFSAACEDAGSPIVSIFPWDGMTTNVSRPNVYIQFSKSLDTETTGSIKISGITYSISGINCDMAFATTSKANDTIVLDPGGTVGDPVELSGTEIGIQIFGFKDSDGNSIEVYTDTDYQFTVPVIVP